MRKLIERIKQIKSIDFKAKFGFSLMEMMVVLLIIAIVAAATAPMVSKKMTKNMGTNDSPWVFTNTNGTVAYNPSGNANATAIIGAANVPAGVNTRLFIDCGDANHSHIAFGRGNSTPMQITADPQGGRVGISNASIPNYTVAFGGNQTMSNSGTYSVAIGYGTNTASNNSVAIGNNAYAAGCGVAIGPSINTTSYGARGACSTAIGYLAKAGNAYSTAIGFNAVADHDHQITLGTASDTVYIPGNLVVGGQSALGTNLGNNTAGLWTRTAFESGYLGYNVGDKQLHFTASSKGNDDEGTTGVPNWAQISDRRLKNVGEKYTAGLEELKKLEFFHYTFKKDKDKTPHVGVIAQDLQEVFPDAVTLGHDGYLRIRMEDMFYAVINAVKELDLKLSEAVESVKNAVEEISGLKTTVEEQQKTIEELQKTNEEFKKMIEGQQAEINELKKEIKNADNRFRKLEKSSKK